MGRCQAVSTVGGMTATVRICMVFCRSSVWQVLCDNSIRAQATKYKATVHVCLFHLHHIPLLPLSLCVVAPFPVTVNAFNGPSYTVWTRGNETIADIKLKLAMQVRVPAEQQRLVFQGKDLEEWQCNVQSGLKTLKRL